MFTHSLSVTLGGLQKIINLTHINAYLQQILINFIIIAAVLSSHFIINGAVFIEKKQSMFGEKITRLTNFIFMTTCKTR